MTTPIYGWRVPQYSDRPPDGAAAFKAFADDVEATYDAAPQAYTPTLTADGSVQPSGLALVQGFWQQRGGWVTVAVYIGFGASTNGGRGPLTVSLPVTSRAVEQHMPCKLFVTAIGGFVGSAWVPPNAAYCRPLFPTSYTNTVAGDWQALAESGTAGSGVPAIPAAASVVNGGNFVLTGRYAVA